MSSKRLLLERKDGEKSMPTFEYKVDDEEQTTTEHELTARQILENAGFDPDNYYLKELDGKDEKSFKDNMDQLIHMHEKMKFIAVYTGQTPVSEK